MRLGRAATCVPSRRANARRAAFSRAACVRRGRSDGGALSAKRSPAFTTLSIARRILVVSSVSAQMSDRLLRRVCRASRGCAPPARSSTARSIRSIRRPSGDGASLGGSAPSPAIVFVPREASDPPEDARHDLRLGQAQPCKRGHVPGWLMSLTRPPSMRCRERWGRIGYRSTSPAPNSRTRSRRCRLTERTTRLKLGR